MVDFVALLQSAEDGNGVLDIRLAHINNLETPLERRIFFDVLAILIESGGTDGAQFSASQGGLQHVGSIDCALSRACAHQRVQFIDEKNDLALRIFNLFEYCLQAILELATIFCSREHGTEIERNHALVLQHLGHIAGDDALRQAFDDGCFTHARLPDQHRIVLGAPGKYLNHAANLFIAANHRVELPSTRLLGQIASVALKSLILGLGILVGNSLRAAHGGQSLQDGIVSRAVTAENLLGSILLELRRRQQQVFRRYVFIFEVVCFFKRALQ